MPSPLPALVDAIRASERLFVLTGAGMGLASGIPTFRGTDPDAVWAKDVTELGTFRYFRADPVGSWRWYRSRFSSIEGAQPNAGHHALVALETWQAERGREMLLVTQNIDTLHRRAGSRNLVEVHGRADRVRCPLTGCFNGAPRGSLDRASVDFSTFDATPSLANLPRCPRCHEILRPHVLWFDEYYGEHVDYGFDRVIQGLRRADLVLCVGTSFSVGVTAAALESRAPKWTIDVAGSAVPPGVRLLTGAQEAVLPAVIEALAG
jgi:NAD-dependent SIR2 family protein deacetylase